MIVTEGWPLTPDNLNALGAAAGYSAKAFGAVGDGATDDTASIQSAIDTANAAGGGTVFLAPGTYVVSRTTGQSYALSVKSNVELRGAGPTATTISLASSTTNQTRIVFVGSASGVGLRDFGVDGNASNQPTPRTQQHAVLLDGSSHVLLDNLYLRNTGGDGTLIMGSTASAGPATVSRCRYAATERNGLTLYNGHRDTRIVANYFHSDISAHGIDSEPDESGFVPGNVVVMGNVLATPTNPGSESLQIGGSSASTPTEKWMVVGNTFGGTIRMERAKDVQIVGNRISGSTQAGIYCTTHAENVVVSGNNVTVNGIPGIRFQYSLTEYPRNVVIADNVVTQLGNNRGIMSEGADQVTIRGNVVRGSGLENGVMVWATRDMKNQVVTDNHIMNFTRGLRVETSGGTGMVRGLVIQGNRFDDDRSTISQQRAIDILDTNDFVRDLVVGGNSVSTAHTIAVMNLHSHTTFLMTGLHGGIGVYSSASSPGSVLTAPIGSLYLRRVDGGASTTLYVKESGTGNTGWVAK